MASPTTFFEDITDALSEDDCSRWWEVEAEKTLETTTSLNDMRLICQYVPFQDPRTPSILLSGRWKWIQDKFQGVATASRDRENNITSRSEAAVAKLLMGVIRSGQGASTPICRSLWAWPNPTPGKDVELISEAVHEHFRSMCEEIPRLDWVRTALGYNLSSVQSLLEHGFSTRQRLDYWVSKSPEGRIMYERIMENEDFLQWVKRLAFLVIRLEDSLLADNVDWDEFFARGSSFLHEISGIDSEELARSMTRADATRFAGVSANDFLDPRTPYARSLGTRSQMLCDDAKACIIINSDFSERIDELVQTITTPTYLYFSVLKPDMHIHPRQGDSVN
ncbi:MAG: hypothetical protein Q9163_005841 [Psora crenata]